MFGPMRRESPGEVTVSRLAGTLVLRWVDAGHRFGFSTLFTSELKSWRTTRDPLYVKPLLPTMIDLLGLHLVISECWPFWLLLALFFLNIKTQKKGFLEKK